MSITTRQRDPALSQAWLSTAKWRLNVSPTRNLAPETVGWSND